MTTDCPLSQRYSKELSQKERRIKKKSKSPQPHLHINMTYNRFDQLIRHAFAV